MYTSGLLIVDDPVNGATTLVDNEMTRRLTATDPAARWRILNDCPTVGCDAHWGGIGDITATPWYRSDDPAAAEFYGLYGQVQIGQPPSTNIVTATGQTTTAAPKTLTFTGVILARTARGAAYGHDWVASILEPGTVPCLNRSATVGLWCPDETCDLPDPLDTFTAGTVDWSTIVGLDGTVPGVPIGPAGAQTVYYDTGRRRIPDVAYVPGSYTETPDPVAPLPQCFGARVTFQFTLATGSAHREATAGCVMDAPAGPPESVCIDLTWDMEEPDPTCGCPVPCDCEPITVGGAVSGSPAPRVTYPSSACDYSTPLRARAYGCLVGPVTGRTASLVATVTAGDALDNVSLTVWEADDAVADPSTPDGLEEYLCRESLGPPALMSHIPAGATMTIDGRARRSWMTCTGDTTQHPAPITRCGGRTYTHTDLVEGRRYWVVFEVECGDADASPGGWRIEAYAHDTDRI